ncbi:phospholipase D-like domain-containing protein [Acidisphaera rubrifaciens]|uniref:Phospholipase D n=1 Tax=Acidisphaera rubrifaciens HS-AP3 TaxID=1231350 RepID=A0A0D6P3M0_9PROT|nr:phospholipase D-like domain-containing protein [Acidisphaera rubrifaciens]GAN75941.1 phosphatidylserine/phosphatidylglycerophosphate/cardiolipin synthase-like protein [Acidisphaera rubrifaciens HS-AP3]
MRRAGALLLAACLVVAPVARAFAVPADVTVCFTAGEPCLGRILAAIDAARSEIRMQAYAFTSRPILAALIAAARRGVDVRLLLDASALHDRGGRAASAAAAGLVVLVDAPDGLAHIKAIIIDRHLVIGGSYNYTRAAERRNVEDVTFIDSSPIAADFLRDWNARAAVATPFVPGRARYHRHHAHRRGW